jgi:alanyl-tRNA synthetase
MQLSTEIRRRFLKFFKERGHALVPSSPVVPHDDPTILFTNAGMNQFKDLFLGKSRRDYTKAATSQKCIRVGGKHNDLDNVGHTSRHLTFFEMLGNFSFGDYFKKEAIAFAWDVATTVYEFDPEKIWVTVFRDDDEAFALWEPIVPASRIVRLGEAENFWAMGETGPCGPCSELLYDRGPAYGKATSPKDDTSGERYLEFWNLVFMQFNRDAQGTLQPLPQQSIDTGSGLERVVSLKMGVSSVFETDLLRGLIAEMEEIAKIPYAPSDAEKAPAFHVIADHIRSLAFAIADGAQPSNTDRGYILRKLLRRAVRYGRLLGMGQPFLARLLPRLIALMGGDYAELKTAEARIAEILTLEEETFLRTLKRGGVLLSTVITAAKGRPHREITGEEAFKLKDTYGLPLEEILLIAKDTHLTVNLDEYGLLEEKAREISRASHAVHRQEAEENLFREFLSKHEGSSSFFGYETTEADATVVGFFVHGKWVETLEAGVEGAIVLNSTPFYAEMGGQVGDTGRMTDTDGSLFRVTGCTSPYPGVVLHHGVCEKGPLILGQPVHVHVEPERRQKIQNNHTATHLLHYALEKILGAHIRQAGSLVEPDRLRFDFTHHKGLSSAELEAIEDIVNDKIRENRPVEAYELPYEQVQLRRDVKQFFGDKYDSVVRVIDIDFSKELCGGTHTASTGTIGYFRIAKEGSIAAGVRRIEAVTGHEAELLVREKERAVHALLSKADEEKKELLHQVKAVRRQTLRALARDLAKRAEMIEGLPFVAAVVSVEKEELPLLMDDLAAELPTAILLLGMRGEGKCQLIIRLSPEAVARSLSALALVKETAPLIGGSGGGKPDMAQAGGKNPDGLETLFSRAKELVCSVLRR